MKGTDIMPNVLNYVEDKRNSELYPTPAELVDKMVSCVDWVLVDTVLEPSAGTGNILHGIARHSYDNRHTLDVDCIEIDGYLRAILKEEFAKGKDDTFYKGVRIVHDDFLTFDTFKRYDLIIMNPPFSCGDKHLLKALEMQRNGGCVVCLLNAETIKNPYTQTRQALVEKLNEYNATIEYMEGAFVEAERKTNVEVALVKVYIERREFSSDIYERMKAAEHIDESSYTERTEMEIADYIKAMVSMFRVEVKSGLELIKQYKAMKPYLAHSFGKNYYDKTPIMELKITQHEEVSENEYLERVRYKYWKALLENPKFVGRLTSTLQDEYRSRVNELKKYDFSEYNITTLSAEMNVMVKSGIEEAAMKMFDRLTTEYSYYPEYQKNVHYYNGWRTNKAHKIDKKVILPCYGLFDSWRGSAAYNAQSVLEDIEKVLNYFDGMMTAEVSMWDILEKSITNGITKNIHLKYFDVTFYKKGTVHITFTKPELIDRYNIYAAQNRKWLPPSYGKKAYSNLDEEERAVVDSFQGEEAYNTVISHPDYYLSPITGDGLLMLDNAG